MNEKKYKVLIDGFIVAERMDLKTATIPIKALFEEYDNDWTMTVSIKEEERTEAA